MKWVLLGLERWFVGRPAWSRAALMVNRGKGEGRGRLEKWGAIVKREILGESRHF
ncbi:hypothetical protein LK494_09330 [Anaerovorax odorimutans]|nr:hypothetical protein [Anaerovorax odorimutans]